MGCLPFAAKPHYRIVMKKVEEIIRQNYITTPPVNARKLASEYGLSVFFAEFPDEMINVCGFIDFNNSKMYVNADDSINRQNFTIAHELGHWLLHKKQIEKIYIVIKFLCVSLLEVRRILWKRKQMLLLLICLFLRRC